jgi:hypothetical protein
MNDNFYISYRRYFRYSSYYGFEIKGNGECKFYKPTIGSYLEPEIIIKIFSQIELSKIKDIIENFAKDNNQFENLQTINTTTVQNINLEFDNIKKDIDFSFAGEEQFIDDISNIIFE